MTRLADRTVAIIGGGIGGLTAALAFAQAGARVTVYEQAPALIEVGAGLQITPNGARVLDALGLSQKASALGVVARAVQPTDALSGRAVTRFDLSRQAPPYRFFYRYDLVSLLYDAAGSAGVSFVFGAKISEVMQDGRFVAEEKTQTPDLLIGADGLHSSVRLLLSNAIDAPFFTGQVAWRAVVPDIAAEPVAKIWMAPGKHVVTYPLRGSGLNVVAVQERSAWAAEGWNHADDPANLQDAFADCGRDLKKILQRIETVNLWGLFRHPVATTWYHDSMAILGDAAHPTLPFLAQGANLALEDAYVLVAALKANQTDAAGLAVYQAKRRNRVTRAINAANANARNYHLSGVKAQVAHAGLRVLGRVAPDAFLNRLSWLYDHDVTKDTYQLAAV